MLNVTDATNNPMSVYYDMLLAFSPRVMRELESRTLTKPKPNDIMCAMFAQTFAMNAHPLCVLNFIL